MEKEIKYIKRFCGVCQTYFAITLEDNWPKEAIEKAMEKITLQSIHCNHENLSPQEIRQKDIHKKGIVIYLAFDIIKE